MVNKEDVIKIVQKYVQEDYSSGYPRLIINNSGISAIIEDIRGLKDEKPIPKSR